MENTSKTKQNNNLGRFFSDAIFLGLLTSLGYGLASVYRSAYFDYFGIPSKFINISTFEIVFVSFFIFLSLLMAGMMAKLVYRLIAQKKDSVQIQFLSVFFAYSIPIWFMRAFITKSYLYILIEGLIVTSLFFLYILILFTLVPKFKEKNEKEPIITFFLDKFFLENQIKRWFGKSSFGFFSLILFIILLMITFCQDLGHRIAQNAHLYIVSNGNIKMAVLEKYDNFLIASPFNEETKELNNQFYFINLSDINKQNYILSQENIGPLKHSDKIEDGRWEKFIKKIESRVLKIFINTN
ncbi:MAG: hypothetical protein WC461_01745 [Candidatus Paceibacterota bacterium]